MKIEKHTVLCLQVAADPHWMAIFEGERCVSQVSWTERKEDGMHCHRFLTAHQSKLSGLHYMAVSIGSAPSFASLRAASCMANAFALVHGTPLRGVSTQEDMSLDAFYAASKTVPDTTEVLPFYDFPAVR
jgi:tRNA A37 threonylcarbamoyladenosine modification protein TsaB